MIYVFLYGAAAIFGIAVAYIYRHAEGGNLSASKFIKIYMIIYLITVAFYISRYIFAWQTNGLTMAIMIIGAPIAASVPIAGFALLIIPGRRSPKKENI